MNTSDCDSISPLVHRRSRLHPTLLHQLFIHTHARLTSSRLDVYSLTMAFGSFQDICEKVALPLCALVGPYNGEGRPGIEPMCYSRTIEAANTIIFEAASGFVHIGALIMCLIMVFHVRSKFTAVGGLHKLFDVGRGRMMEWEESSIVN